ncbi:CBS domain-containing protein CBSX3-mitochondrial [Striga hermonthica]|uniref:CBS domain-containing protein CBSX3-mitochondrial n=1 Tax=Striga hermonthica TaxID=68872 RepID=A0A9N7RIY4_STRHE|nr:CBS domain-containing protein CBSX3-mitochondrial [Striga hermonthica]
MQGGIKAIFFSNGSLLKNVILRHVRVVPPAMTRTQIFARHVLTSTARIEEHGFESTTISDVLKAKGKGADGSWLWCTTDDSVYEAAKSMTQHNVGALVVVKPGAEKFIAGIITKRDTSHARGPRMSSQMRTLSSCAWVMAEYPMRGSPCASCTRVRADTFLIVRAPFVRKSKQHVRVA